MSFSKEQLKWMAQILLERFGVTFIIEYFDDTLILSVAGHDEKITFPILEKNFYVLGTTTLNCYEWNANENGLKGVIEPILKAPSVNLLKQPLIQYIDNGVLINYDILGLTYWMLNRLEEIGRSDLDTHGRFSARSSHAWKFDYLDRPIVDEWLDILGQVIKRVWGNVQLKKHNFQLNITHDVDVPARFGFSSPADLVKPIMADVLKRGKIYNLFLIPYIRFNTKYKIHDLDPYNTFDWIMSVSEKYNVKSSFYFICGNTDPSKDANYSLTHPAIQRLLLDIHKRGHEIGLHPSYNSYLNKDVISKEFLNLKSTCEELGIIQNQWGGRMHFLRWRHPETMLYWDECGLNYDSTLGYADYAGFRAGTCYEYQAFDAVHEISLNLRLKPLVAMECTILHERYMGISENPLDLFLDLKRKCEKVNGIFTLLWHNSQLSSLSYKKIYEALFE
ncbi:polysaccharide deacetylase family protein [Acinetobacter vivianii]|uniref:Polysaccharide deacetylase family protein n=1 Tax=Acinetobacter vivianii TaxID=1776742 RepID=A0AAJ6P574_9GAMM|nr:polysaccharide deacetylase family protein [Acinetobacter vivianii]WDZ51159.1 polysaccharide deacetylase family protein [Acinetobacter vivianii]